MLTKGASSCCVRRSTKPRVFACILDFSTVLRQGRSSTSITTVMRLEKV